MINSGAGTQITPITVFALIGMIFNVLESVEPNIGLYDILLP